jgi:hypothetical protein
MNVQKLNVQTLGVQKLNVQKLDVQMLNVQKLDVQKLDCNTICKKRELSSTMCILPEYDLDINPMMTPMESKHVAE